MTSQEAAQAEHVRKAQEHSMQRIFKIVLLTLAGVMIYTCSPEIKDIPLKLEDHSTFNQSSSWEDWNHVDTTEYYVNSPWIVMADEQSFYISGNGLWTVDSHNNVTAIVIENYSPYNFKTINYKTYGQINSPSGMKVFEMKGSEFKYITTYLNEKELDLFTNPLSSGYDYLIYNDTTFSLIPDQPKYQIRGYLRENPIFNYSFKNIRDPKLISQSVTREGSFLTIAGKSPGGEHIIEKINIESKVIEQSVLNDIALDAKFVGLFDNRLFYYIDNSFICFSLSNGSIQNYTLNNEEIIVGLACPNRLQDCSSLPTFSLFVNDMTWYLMFNSGERIDIYTFKSAF